MYPNREVLQRHGYERCGRNPLIVPADVCPTIPEFKVIGAFNPGATQLGSGETLLLVRVAEAFATTQDSKTLIPLAKPQFFAASDASSGQSELVDHCAAAVHKLELASNNPDYDFCSDARVVLSAKTAASGVQTVKYLTSLSHLRLARSVDGITFDVDKVPFLFPGVAHAASIDSPPQWLASMLVLEEWGIEDPRIVDMGNLPGPNGLMEALPAHMRTRLPLVPPGHSWRFLVTFTAVSRFGAATSMAAVTDDFTRIARLCVLFAPENKDVCIFPAAAISTDAPAASCRFACYHRPVPKSFGNPDIWCATSNDLVSWGDHRHCLGTAVNPTDVARWDAGRVGGGAPSVRTAKGWLHVYHAADVKHRYCLGVFLASVHDPAAIVARATVPLLSPDAEYEAVGFFPNVVFTCGVVLKPGQANDDAELWVYYGAADDKVALCVFSMRHVFSVLGV